MRRSWMSQSIDGNRLLLPSTGFLRLSYLFIEKFEESNWYTVPAMTLASQLVSSEWKAYAVSKNYLPHTK